LEIERTRDPRSAAIAALERMTKPPVMSELLARAFAALGAGPTQRELELVADDPRFER
jgi:hypothetical protein